MQTLLLQTTTCTVLKNAMRLVIFISLAFAGSISALAAQSVKDWQLHRLLHPTEAQRKNDQKGHVFIYDDISEQDVDHAMDKQFNRIDSMMFIHVKKSKDNHSASESEDEDVDTDDAGCD